MNRPSGQSSADYLEGAAPGITPGRRFLLIIGAPKSATTSLHDMVMQMDGARQCGPEKEPRFFTSMGDEDWSGPNAGRLSSDMVLDEAAYLDGFGPGAALSVDSSTDYLWREEAPARAAAFAQVADVRAIALLRDPIERAFSEYQHTRRDGMQTESFQRSLELEDERAAARMHPLFYHMRRSRYHADLQRWRTAFGDRFLALDHGIVRQPDALAGALGTFLQAPGLSFTQTAHSNASSVTRFPWLKKAMRSPALKAAARAVVPPSMRHGVYERLTAANSARLTMTEADADAAWRLLADDAEACIADPDIPTDGWRTVHAARARHGVA